MALLRDVVLDGRSADRENHRSVRLSACVCWGVGLFRFKDPLNFRPLSFANDCKKKTPCLFKTTRNLSWRIGCMGTVSFLPLFSFFFLFSAVDFVVVVVAQVQQPDDEGAQDRGR